MPSGFCKNGLYWETETCLQNNHPTILFLHASWMSSTMWEETARLLSPQLHNVNLLRIDLNGHGKTIASRKEYSLWDQAEDVLALLKEFSLSSVLIAGISMGSMIALRLALLDQSRFSGLILLGSNAGTSSEAVTRAFYEFRDIWVSTPTPSEQVMNAAIIGWGGSPDLEGPRATKIKRDWVERHSGAENIDPILKSTSDRESILDRMGEIRIPVLLIHGEDDKTFPLHDAVDMQERLVNTNVRLEVVKGEGHLVIHMREPQDVVEWIWTFSKRVFS